MRFLLPALLLCSLLTAIPLSTNASTVDQAPVDLNGTWTIDYQTTAVTDFPIVRDFHITTRAQLVATVEQDGNNIDLTTRVCRLDLVSDLPGARPVAPAAFAESLPEVRRRAELVESDGEWELRIHPKWQTVGVNLDDPSNDDLPSDADDSRVFDQDGDGNPGNTIWIRGAIDGEIYVIQRSWDRWRGRIVDDNTIQGAIQWNTEQSVVDSTHRILRRQPSADAHPDPTKNIFRMTRAEGSPPC